MSYPDGIANQPIMLTLIMASRRTGDDAQATRERFVETTAQIESGSGILFDRTPDGVIWSPSAMNTIRDLGSRFSVVRQGSVAPISDVWRELDSVPGAWIMGFHDDDHWVGIPIVPTPSDPRVTLYAPNVLVSDGTAQWAAHEWTSQHALFGAIRSDVFRMIAQYLASAPSPWGGEDLMLLSLAGSMGQIERMDGYTYVWRRHNWTSVTSDSSTQSYLAEQGWEELSSLSTYLLLQSFDRLAVFAYADEVDDDKWRRGVDEVLATFWPVIDRRGHDLLRRLPSRLRGALISTRGEGTGPRRFRSLIRTAPRSIFSVCEHESFQAFESGRNLVRTPHDVSHSLLPAFAKEAPVRVQPQLDYWDWCIAKVADRYSWWD